MRKQQKVIIASKFLMYCHALKKLVETKKSYQVTYFTTSGKELMEYLKTASEEILLMDINLKNETGYQLINKVKRRCPHLRILVVTEHLHPYTVSYLLKYGALGIVSLRSDAGELNKALSKVSVGEHYFNKIVRKTEFKNILSGKQQVYKLTATEIRFIRLASKQMTYEEIATKMKIKERQVDQYRENLFKAFEIRNRTGLLIFAIRTGIVEL